MLSGQAFIELLDPVVAPMDLQVLSATWRARVLDLRLEHFDASSPSLDEIAQASKLVSMALDDIEDLAEDSYTLEVSSPGLERPLVRLAHFRWAIGRTVRFTSSEGVVEGVLVRVVDETEPRIEVEVYGSSRSFSLREVDKATTLFQWGANSSKKDGRRQVGGA